jgi:hypothetical protein
MASVRAAFAAEASQDTALDLPINDVLASEVIR